MLPVLQEGTLPLVIHMSTIFDEEVRKTSNVNGADKIAFVWRVAFDQFPVNKTSRRWGVAVLKQ